MKVATRARHRMTDEGTRKAQENKSDSEEESSIRDPDARTHRVNSMAPLRPLLRDQDEWRFDSNAVTYLTCDNMSAAVLKMDRKLENFVVYLPMDGVLRKKYVSGACAHVQQTPDEHRLCRACELLVTGQLCRTTACRMCAEMSAEARTCRRVKIPRTGCLQFEQMGGAYEASRLFERYAYLEGVLWLLVGAYRPDENLKALRRCRANIKELLKRQQGAPVYQSHHEFDERARGWQPMDKGTETVQPTARYVVQGPRGIERNTSAYHERRIETIVGERKGDREWLATNRRSQMPLRLYVTEEGGSNPYEAVRHRARERGYAAARADRGVRMYRFHVRYVDRGATRPPAEPVTKQETRIRCLETNGDQIMADAASTISGEGARTEMTSVKNEETVKRENEEGSDVASGLRLDPSREEDSTETETRVTGGNRGRKRIRGTTTDVEPGNERGATGSGV